MVNKKLSKTRKKNKYFIRIEEASGMYTNPRKYIVVAFSKVDAAIKGIIKDGYTKKEAIKLWKRREREDDVYILGGDAISIEIDKI